MKYLQIITVLIFIGLGFTSCEPDQDLAIDKVATNNTIVGVWKPIMEIKVCIEGQRHIEHFTECEQKSRFTFHSDNTYASEEWKSKSPNSKECALDDTISGVWSKDKDQLTVQEGGISELLTVYKLNNKEMEVGKIANTGQCVDGKFLETISTVFERQD